MEKSLDRPAPGSAAAQSIARQQSVTAAHRTRARCKTFLGVEFDDLDMASALEWVRDAAAADRFSYVVTPNVDHIVKIYGKRRPAWLDRFHAAIVDSDLCLNDSRILSLLARLSGLSLMPVSGSDLTKELIVNDRMPPGTAVVLIGGGQTEGDWLAAALPGRSIHQYIPPMGILDSVPEQIRIAEFVEQKGPATTFMAFGVPQSELVASLIKQRGLARGTCLCVGASIEFLSGSRRRAPLWMRRASLEWLHRLLSEPRRMWRRYLVDGPRIFLIWWRDRRG